MNTQHILKFHFESGKPEADGACAFCQMRYGQYDLDQANVHVVLGGDGSVLTALRKQLDLNLNIPIFALNYGSKGFLANDPSIDNLCERIQKAQRQVVNPLKITMTSDINGHKKEAYAFNDFAILRSSPQAAHLPIFVRSNEIKFKLYTEGDGLLIATPTGSHAYYASTGGKPLDISQKGILVRTINSAKPIDLFMHESTKLGVCKYQGDKRPIMIEGDGQRFEHVSRAVVNLAPEKRKILLFETKRQNQR